MSKSLDTVKTIGLGCANSMKEGPNANRKKQNNVGPKETESMKITLEEIVDRSKSGSVLLPCSDSKPLKTSVAEIIQRTCLRCQQLHSDKPSLKDHSIKSHRVSVNHAMCPRCSLIFKITDLDKQHMIEISGELGKQIEEQLDPDSE